MDTNHLSHKKASLKRSHINDTGVLANIFRDKCHPSLTVFPFKLLTNGRNNFQHYWATNVGSCCVRVGSGVQTDATYPNNVGVCIASWEGYSPSDVGNLLQ